MLAYRFMRGFLRLVLRIFYRQIEVVGLENIPAEGEAPVIFAGNHPNSLIDPVLIVATSGRIVHFAAKDVLFRSRVLRVFLDALGAVPIMRRRDHAGEAVDNASAFQALFDVLRARRSIGIFPEGISHDEAQLAQFKTGAARIALGVMAQESDLPLKIIPCGLTYTHRRHFRSRVLVQFGTPITISAEQMQAEDERETARELTDEVEHGLRALTINSTDWDTLRVLDGVRRLYQPPKIPLRDRVELARRFALHYEDVREEPEVVELFARVKDFIERLDDIGLSDGHLRRSLRPGFVMLKVLSALIWTFILLPLAAPGVVVHAPIGLFVGWAGQRFTPRKDVLATSKLVIGLLLVILVYAAAVVLIAISYGLIACVASIVLLPVTGYATVRALERTGSMRRLAMRLARILVFRREVEALRKLRGELEADVVRAVGRYKPDDLVALYPRTDDEDAEGT